MLRHNLFFFVPFALAIGLFPLVFPNVLAAEIPHSFYVDTTEFTNAAASGWTNITNYRLDSSEFTADRKYLIIANNLVYTQTNGALHGIRVMHGTTDFPYSELSREHPANDFGELYSWFTVWTAVAGEDIYVQYNRGANTFAIDSMTLFAMEISEELTENTDWFYDNTNDTKTDLSTTWSTTNNANVTFTPSGAGELWLIATTAWQNNTDTTNEHQSRINSVGTITETQPQKLKESEISTTNILLTLYRSFILNSESNSFAEQSGMDSGTLGDRWSSSIFALNLEQFETQAGNWTEAEQAPGTPAGWANVAQTHTNTITPLTEGDVLVIATNVYEGGNQNRGHYQRLQTDNIDTPAGVTDQLPRQMLTADGGDDLTLHHLFLQNLDTSSHSFDLDTGDGGIERTTEDRDIIIFSMELAGGVPPIEHNESDQVVYGDFLNVTLDSGAVVHEQDLDDLVTYGDFVGTLLLNEISTNATDQVVYGDFVSLIIPNVTQQTDQVFYADFVNATLNVGGAPGGPIIPVPGVTPQGLSLIEWIVYGFFAYGAMLMLMIGIVKDIPGTRTTSLLRIIFILPGIIGAGILAGPYETVIMPTTDTVNAITLTTENFTETIISTSYIQLQNPVWLIFHYAIMAVMIIYTISQVLTMLTTAPLEANRNKGNV